jgi:hypothetical protein
MAYSNNYNKGFGGDNDEAAGLVYDLRQTYAQILDEVLKRIAECRVQNNYIEWFNSLEHLQIEINQKLTEDERKDYAKELKKCVETLNQYSAEFNKVSKNSKGIFAIKCSLMDLEKWLKVQMEEHKLFGAKDMEDDGL